MFWLLLILFVSCWSAMDSGKLLPPRLINENKRVTHYRSESGTRFKDRKKKYAKKELVKNLQQKAQAFVKQLAKGTNFQEEFKNPYEFHVKRLEQGYTKTFQECKKNDNLLILLSEFDFNSLKKDKYRSMCIWLVPCIMAFADLTFDQEAKMIFLPRLFEKCARVVKW
jgi:hypothetical protein